MGDDAARSTALQHFRIVTSENGCEKGFGKRFMTNCVTRCVPDMGRAEQSTVAMADSQSVKTREKRGASALGCADLKQLAWRCTVLTGAKRLKDACVTSSLIRKAYC